MRASNLAFIALAGCANAIADAPSGSDVSTRFEHDMIVRFHMHENFGLVRTIEHLLVRNKLAEAKELARGIAEAPDEPGTAPWAKETARVRERAQAITVASTREGAVRAVTELGDACASCHRASGTLPDLGAPPPAPKDERTLSSTMARHRWATDRIWEGTIGMSDESWKLGVKMLAETAPPSSELGGERAPYAKALQRVAASARDAKPDDRARRYAEILNACASCHALP
ncbi:MAG: hypothetical protein QM831_36135 [Kofleriaceae bacterium]